MRAFRVDKNQKELVSALRDCGMTVHHTHGVGKGFPDIVVGFCGMNFLIEIKKSPVDELTLDQKTFHDNWAGSIITGYSAGEIIDAIVSRAISRG